MAAANRRGTSVVAGTARGTDSGGRGHGPCAAASGAPTRGPVAVCHTRPCAIAAASTTARHHGRPPRRGAAATRSQRRQCAGRLLLVCRRQVVCVAAGCRPTAPQRDGAARTGAGIGRATRMFAACDGRGCVHPHGVVPASTGVPADTRRIRDAGSGALSNKPPHTRVCRVPQRRTGTVTQVGNTPTYRAPYRWGAQRRVTPSAGRGGAGGQQGACGCSRAHQERGGAHETPRAAVTRGGGGRRNDALR